MSPLIFRSRRRLIGVFLAFLVVFETVAYATSIPHQREYFLQLYVLGANRLLTDYYPNNDPDIGLGEQVQWHVGVTSFMGTVQLVAIRLKLGNETAKPPDEVGAQPSSAFLVVEFWQFLQDNATWEMPLFWQITEAEVVDGYVWVLELQISDQTYRVANVMAVDGYNFRFIIELWTWEAQSDSLQLGWSTGSERRIAWVQLWFNMTSPLY